MTLPLGLKSVKSNVVSENLRHLAHDTTCVVVRLANDRDKALTTTGREHQLVQTDVSLLTSYGFNGRIEGAAFRQATIYVPIMVIYLGRGLVVQIEVGGNSDCNTPAVTVFACGTNLDCNGCCRNLLVGRIHFTTLLLYIFAVPHKYN